MSDFAVRKKLGTGSSATVTCEPDQPSGLARPKAQVRAQVLPQEGLRPEEQGEEGSDRALIRHRPTFVVALYRTFNENEFGRF